MSKLRSINTAIWGDTWFEELTPTRKLIFIYCITNEKTNMLGVYEISLKKISFETGIHIDDVKNSFSFFESENKIFYTNNRVFIKNHLKHQKYNFNMMKSAIEIYNELPDGIKMQGINTLEKTESGFETLLNGFGMVSKVENEDEKETEVETEVETEDESEKGKKNLKSIVYSQSVHDCYEEVIKYFSEDLIPDTDQKRNNWLDTIDKLQRIDEFPIEAIPELVKRIRADDFWKSNFQSILKLRKNNPDGIKYYKYFFHKFGKDRKSTGTAQYIQAAMQAERDSGS